MGVGVRTGGFVGDVVVRRLIGAAPGEPRPVGSRQAALADPGVGRALGIARRSRVDEGEAGPKRRRRRRLG